MIRKLTAAFLLLIIIPSVLPGTGDDDYEPTTLVFPSFLHTMGIRKATKLHLMIYTKNKVKVQNPQGIAVVRLKSWDDPDKKEDDDEVTGYGVNSGENVIVYNTSMTSLNIYGKNEVGERALKNPTGIAANEYGDVYVADTGNHRIVRFNNPQKKLEFVGAIGGQGALPGQFESPRGVAIDSQGKVYISDTGNHRIQILRPDDVLHLWFGKQGIENGELWHPAGIAVMDREERWSYYKENFIAVIDLEHSRIQKFTLDGKYLKATRLNDFGFETGHLAYLAIDYYNNIWATDTNNHCVHKFDRNLNHLTSFGRKGKGDKEFIEPRGIAIYRRFGQVFIAEKESAQYYWIGTDVSNFNGKWNTDLALIELDLLLTEPSYLTLLVETETDNNQIEILTKKLYFSGQQKIYLDGNWKSIPRRLLVNRLREGNSALKSTKTVVRGNYTFKLKIEPTYSSYKYFHKNVESTITINYE